MWSTEEKRYTTATKEQIWKLWADVQHWNDWDRDVELSELSGEFKTGTKGILKPTNGPKAGFEIIELTFLKSFTNRSLLPLCKMDFSHSMMETKNGIEIVHKVEMTGIMTFLFSRVIGSKIKVGLPVALDNFIRLAEKK